MDSFIATRINFLLCFACQKILKDITFLRMCHKGFIKVILKLLSHWNLVKSKGTDLEKTFFGSCLPSLVPELLVFYWLVDWSCPVHVSLSVIIRGVLQALFSSIYLSVFLDGFILRIRRCSLFSMISLDQLPIVLEAGDVSCNECSDTVEGTEEQRLFSFWAERNSVGIPVSTRRGKSLQWVIQRKSLGKQGGTFPSIVHRK